MNSYLFITITYQDQQTKIARKTKYKAEDDTSYHNFDQIESEAQMVSVSSKLLVDANEGRGLARFRLILE